MRLNGLQRLWIFASLCWLGAVGVAWHATLPVGEEAPDHPAYFYQLKPSSRALLLPDNATGSATEVSMPNGYVLRFRSGAGHNEQQAVAREYHEITVRAQAELRAQHHLYYLFLATVPCILVALLGLGIAWVRRGFRPASRVEP